MVKCRLFGVTVPLSIWCGVRACEVRISFFGLLRVRTTCFSNFEGVCSAGVTSPRSSIHGSSLSGSAAAPVSDRPVDAAPASARPLPSSARRCSRPLPATVSCDVEWPLPRRSSVLMVASLADRRLGAPSSAIVERENSAPAPLACLAGGARSGLDGACAAARKTILTTHTGSLPRPAKVVELLLAEQAKPGAQPRRARRRRR